VHVRTLLHRDYDIKPMPCLARACLYQVPEGCI